MAVLIRVGFISLGLASIVAGAFGDNIPLIIGGVASFVLGVLIDWSE